VRVNTRPCVRALSHEQTGNFRLTVYHGVLDRAMLIAIGNSHIGELWPRLQHRSHTLDGAVARGFNQSPDRHAIYVSFQFWPAIEP